ncbi:CidA/LrgA family protein [Paraburkholderia adhaesiva]|uniref:CidA/LrgA family protein n=1 Tax=Paraburkholderia adhaesiva TaxID=2883244 RepID=UPI001F28CC4E|nr:CidA/LrgA family protein [Paraburkholderia adhaesiva]
MTAQTEMQKTVPVFAIRSVLQAGGLIAVFVVLTFAGKWLGTSINPALAGFVAVLAGLFAKLVPVSAVEGGARLLISQSALFLIPPGVAVARQRDLLVANWLPIAAIVVGGTVICVVATSFSVELATRALQRGRA